jgi:hypothetical protein
MGFFLLFYFNYRLVHQLLLVYPFKNNIGVFSLVFIAISSKPVLDQTYNLLMPFSHFYDDELTSYLRYHMVDGANSNSLTAYTLCHRVMHSCK